LRCFPVILDVLVFGLSFLFVEERPTSALPCGGSGYVVSLTGVADSTEPPQGRADVGLSSTKRKLRPKTKTSSMTGKQRNYFSS
jgi:hypothetical protein